MKLSVRDMIMVAIFAALTAIGAFIQIPTPLVPFSLQYMFCAFSGLLLGSRKGMMSQGLYIAIGLIGIPVFTKGGGIGYVLQPTFGYLLGFFLCAFIIGKLTERIQNLNFIKILLSVLAGLSAVYIIGVTYLWMILNLYMGNPVSLLGAIKIGIAPFIITDLIQTVIIAFMAVIIIPRLRKLGFISQPIANNISE